MDRDPAEETAFMWNEDKVKQLDEECRRFAGPRGSTIYFDGLRLIIEYARSLLQYLKKMCRS
jgi:hypothetical protein